jgi:hypothetical protein
MSGKETSGASSDPATSMTPEMASPHPGLSSSAPAEDCQHGSNARSLDRYSCPECHARLEANIDDVLVQVLMNMGWTANEFSQVTMQQFVQKPISEIRPDPAKSKEIRRREFALMVMREQDARKEAAIKWKADKEASRTGQ